MAIVRSVVIIIMQLLRETAKAPFTNNNHAEIARMLVNEQINMVKLLSDAAKGVKINSKKAGSMLNLILAPLELLIKYNISFTLHLSKPITGPEVEEVIEEPIDDELDKFEIYDAEEEFEASEHSSSSSNIQGAEENEEDIDEDSDPASNVWIQNRQNEEFLVERHIIDQRFQLENEEGEPWNGGPRRWDIVEGEETGQIINLFREQEGNDNDL